MATARSAFHLTMQAMNRCSCDVNLHLKNIKKFSRFCASFMFSRRWRLKSRSFGFWRPVVTSPWRWQQHGPPKRRHYTTLYCVTTQKAWLEIWDCVSEEIRISLQYNVGPTPFTYSTVLGNETRNVKELTPLSRGRLQKPAVARSRYSPPFMKPEVPLPWGGKLS
jgi:hypothetical protein